MPEASGTAQEVIVCAPHQSDLRLYADQEVIVCSIYVAVGVAIVIVAVTQLRSQTWQRRPSTTQWRTTGMPSPLLEEARAATRLARRRRRKLKRRVRNMLSAEQTRLLKLRSREGSRVSFGFANCEQMLDCCGVERSQGLHYNLFTDFSHASGAKMMLLLCAFTSPESMAEIENKLSRHFPRNRWRLRRVFPEAHFRSELHV